MQGYNGGTVINMSYVLNHVDLMWLECLDNKSNVTSLVIRLTEETKLMEWGDKVFWNNDSTVWISQNSLGTLTPIERVGHTGVSLNQVVDNPAYGTQKWT